MIQNMNEATMSRLEKLFHNAHALALAGRPYTDFVWMAKLDQAKGLDVGSTYLNDKAAHQFIDAIASVEMEHLKDKLLETNFVSILSDGTTDVSVQENEIFYIRMCIKGTITVHFLKCAIVPKGDALTIFRAMKRSVEATSLEWEDVRKKIVGMGSDGAAVMLGINNGVAALLRQEQPCSIAIHCYAHKLELAYKDAIKVVPLDKKAITLLQGLYYLYHNSALNRSNLKAAFSSLGQKPFMPTRVGGTRWVAHLLRALKNFFAGYDAIKVHLEQVVRPMTPIERVSCSTSGKAAGLLQLMTHLDTVLYLHNLADVLTVLSRLSLVFQERNASAAVIHGSVAEAKALIQHFEEHDGPYLTKAKSIFCDGAVQVVGAQFHASKQQLIIRLTTSLDDRFEMPGIIEAMKVANFKVWPLPEDLVEIQGFGEDCIKVLTCHYQSVLETAGVDAAEAAIEWCALKAAIYSSQAANMKSLTWERVNRLYPDQYQQILVLIDLILSLPGASAECERGFRMVKAVKTDIRSSLGELSLSNLLMIQLHSPPIETFDPLPAIHLWNQGGVRRPLFWEGQKESKKKMQNKAAATASATMGMGLQAQHDQDPDVQPSTSSGAQFQELVGSVDSDTSLSPSDKDSGADSELDERTVDELILEYCC
ncbi:PREDICTED: zinc finger protein 862-like [Priapulus caudatus]|uniref:Zinc finger protein 862-like n=1 Tax=Priapulus caudatus TaxID=37621 RepID=A0ABM1EUL1_PRICU|nr:PREDICTED: zinc finger protein 862-like [Priapulus caudatus]